MIGSSAQTPVYTTRNTNARITPDTSENKSPQQPFQNMARKTAISRPGSPSPSLKRSDTKLQSSLLMYKRQPSPRPPSAGSKERAAMQPKLAADRAKVQTAPLKLSVKSSRCEVVKGKRTSEMEPTIRTQSSQTSRPKTADPTKRDKDTVDDRVIHTVKTVLSQVVIEKGKIDSSNIETVIDHMTRQLEHEDSDSEQNDYIEVDQKRTRTKLSIINSSQDMTARSARPAVGIVRKKVEDKPNQRYLRVYNCEASAQKGSDSTLTYNYREPTTYIDPPDSDSSNFKCIQVHEDAKKGAERSERCKMEVLKSNHDKEDSIQTQKPPKGESVIGDGQVDNDKTPHLNITNDEVKLQNYIQYLIRSMQSEMKDKSFTSLETFSEAAHCKSVCACHVCLSKKEIDSKSSTCKEDLGEKKQLNTKLTSSIKVKDNKPTQASVSTRQAIMSKKQSSAKTGLKVLRRNINIQPGSKLNVISRSNNTTMDDNNASNSLSACGETEECNDDMYLQRRIQAVNPRQTSPVRKNISQIQSFY